MKAPMLRSEYMASVCRSDSNSTPLTGDGKATLSNGSAGPAAVPDKLEPRSGRRRQDDYAAPEPVGVDGVGAGPKEGQSEGVERDDCGGARIPDPQG